jgi:amino acid adenylation domain-containing protein
MNYNLAQPFYESACKSPGNVAINANGQELLYRDVLQQVMAVSGWLREATTPARVGILASRSAEACIGILASSWVGATYVALNLAYPEEALLDVIKRSGLDALIADKEGSELLTPQIRAACPALVLAHQSSIPGGSSRHITDYDDLSSSETASEPVHVDRHAPGYILYTSGSTGVPKGVIVPVGAVDHFLRAMDSKYALQPEDRIPETAAISFDISIYNMFAAWRAGASLHIIPTKQMMIPSRFIQDHQLTVWFSVPSVATFMARMKLLHDGTFPSLRLTFFCGEPLLGTVADQWQKAAPFSRVINMYGPTEATVMCTGEDFGPDCAMTRDIVAIGRPFDGMKAAVATPELNWIEDEGPGELLLSGPQLALGYFNDPKSTASKFVDIDGERWYRTGDLALRDRNGTFHYLGRIDNQVKVRGYRVELEDVEAHLRAVTSCLAVAAIAWPIQDRSASGIVAFVVEYEGEIESIREAMKQRVPFYMVPTEIHSLLRLPMNSNHKIDRNALTALLASGLRTWPGEPQLNKNPAAWASE